MSRPRSQINGFNERGRSQISRGQLNERGGSQDFGANRSRGQQSSRGHSFGANRSRIGTSQFSRAQQSSRDQSFGASHHYGQQPSRSQDFGANRSRGQQSSRGHSFGANRSRIGTSQFSRAQQSSHDQSFGASHHYGQQPSRSQINGFNERGRSQISRGQLNERGGSQDFGANRSRGQQSSRGHSFGANRSQIASRGSRSHFDSQQSFGCVEISSSGLTDVARNSFGAAPPDFYASISQMFNNMNIKPVVTGTIKRGKLVKDKHTKNPNDKTKEKPDTRKTTDGAIEGGSSTNKQTEGETGSKERRGEEPDNTPK